ncbi:MAG: hypothetical protein ACW96N_00485 [Candidatus Thorarchaeota archaeon]|jgi:hypothetical protein
MNEDQTETIELESFKSSSSSKIIAVGAILSAVYAITVVLPMSQFIGAGSGSILSFAICIAPLFGLILGPRYGFVFGGIAGLLATIVSIQFGGLYLLIPTIILGPAISGLLTGLCLRPVTEIQGVRVPGPIITAGYLLLVIILYLLPLYEAWWYILPYALAILVAVVLQAFKFRFDSAASFSRIPLQILPLTLIGSLTDYSMMTLGSVYLLGLDAIVFGTFIFPVMLLERTISVVISAIIAGVLFTAFRNELFVEA